MDDNNFVPSPFASSETFAPESQVQASHIAKPSSGGIIEVTVAWKERVIQSHHFSGKRSVTIGSDPKNDINLPIGSKSHCLLKINKEVKILLSPLMTGELTQRDGKVVPMSEILYKGDLRKGSSSGIIISQGEMFTIRYGELIIYVSFTKKTAKPLVAPLLDFTASEFTAVLLAVMVAAVFWLYMLIYIPKKTEDEKDPKKDPVRIARVVFHAIKKVPVKESTRVKIVSSKKKIKSKSTAKKKTRSKKKARKKLRSRARRAKNPTKKKARARAVAPKKTKSKRKSYTSARKGGAVKTGRKKGSGMKTKNPTAVGLLSVFGSGGRKKFDKTSRGSGDLAGIADRATGKAGFSEDRRGDNFGTKDFGDGAGGKGTSTIGISGLGTKGKGTGNYGVNSGGLGKKGSVNIEVGGFGEDIAGFLDKEAIRRVIRRNRNVIRYCYELQLNRNKNLYGKIILSWDIISRGRVKNARVKSNSLGQSRPARAVANCVLRRLRTWKFPEPPVGVIGEVTFPFVFTSR